MNKKMIALAVAAAAFSGASTAAEVFANETSSLSVGGRAELRYANEKGATAEDKSRARINVAGTSVITDELTAIGFAELEFNADSEFSAKDYFAGVAGNFGQVTIGSQDGAVGVITDFTDINAYFGNVTGNGDSAPLNLVYAGDFDALSIKAAYAQKTADQDTAFSASAIYTLGDIAFGGAFHNEDSDNEFHAAASYTMGDIYLAGLYRKGEHTNGYELAASYSLNNTVFSTSYGVEDKEDDGQLTFDATHYLNANLRGFVAYNVDMNSGAKDTVAAGVRYSF